MLPRWPKGRCAKTHFALACALGGALLAGCQLPTMPDLGLTDWYIYGGSDHKHDHLYGSIPANRIAALKKLQVDVKRRSQQEQERVVMELVEQIRNESDPLVRVAILETAALYPVPLAGQILRAGLRDQAKEVRTACCTAWGKRGGPEAVEALGTALSTDAEIDVRLAAAESLGRTSEPGAIAALAVALEDRQDPALQYRAVQSLRAIGPRDLGNDVEKWRQFAKNPQAPLPEGPSLAQRLQWWE
jgi:HEAT repeat protein